MAEAGSVFKRYELKYLLNRQQYEELRKTLNEYTIPDKFSESTVCSLYYDTPDKLLIRRSLDKPEYKEKLRLRSYGVADRDSEVFVELKKKYDGIVYKRRISLGLEEAIDYLENDKEIANRCQISDEIDYFLNFYKNITPSMLLTYDRTALVVKDDPSIRITFDRNILYREEDLRLDCGIYGTRVIGPDEVLMELKVSGGIPMWLAKRMNELKIYKSSFSKYGTAYQMSMAEQSLGRVQSQICAKVHKFEKACLQNSTKNERMKICG